MSPLDWFRKESPILSLLGLGGGAGSPLYSGSSGVLDSSGGTKISPGPGTEVFHIFTSNGNLVISEAGGGFTKMEIVSVGGGGGGGRGGGGGGGGVLHAPGAPLVAATMAVTIGTGGPGNEDGNGKGISGGNTTFAHPGGDLIGYGGGGGGGSGTPVGDTAGGNGGGAGIDTGVAGGPANQPNHANMPFTVNKYGNAGGQSPANAPYVSGGGGGAQAGGSGNRFNIGPAASTGGDGGAAQPFGNFGNPVIAPAVTDPAEPYIGTSGLFGAGGGGGNNLNNPTNAPRPAGGNGGGGVGAGPHEDGPGGQFNGTNYGGGGGGKEAEPSTVDGGNGYQGIVLVRIYKD